MTASPWITRQEASERLKISPITLDRWARKGLLNRYTVPGLATVRYRVDEVDAVLNPSTVEDPPAVTAAAS